MGLGEWVTLLTAVAGVIAAVTALVKQLQQGGQIKSVKSRVTAIERRVVHPKGPATK